MTRDYLGDLDALGYTVGVAIDFRDREDVPPERRGLVYSVSAPGLTDDELIELARSTL
jgi:hypothetical protein